MKFTILMFLFCSGCAATGDAVAMLKRSAPDSWNVTYYEPTGADKSGRMVGLGISGPLPWAHQ